MGCTTTRDVSRKTTLDEKKKLRSGKQVGQQKGNKKGKASRSKIQAPETNLRRARVLTNGKTNRLRRGHPLLPRGWGLPKKQEPGKNLCGMGDKTRVRLKGRGRVEARE